MVTPPEIAAPARAMHSANAPDPMLVTLAGRMRLVRLAQP